MVTFGSLLAACTASGDVGWFFGKTQITRDNNFMSSMAPVYRGEDLDKQIYTMHITAVCPSVHRHQQVGGEEPL